MVLATSLYTVRIVLQALGVSDFGIYGLAGGMVALFAFLNATMTRAAQRFLGVEIGRGDNLQLNRMFNAILVANSVVALFVVAVCLTLGLWLLNHKFEIPSTRLPAANTVFLYSIATTVAMILRTPYSALIISRQKMWFFSITSIIESGLKLTVAFLISHTDYDRLEFYALLMCAVSWLMLVWYAGFCRHQFIESKLAPYRERALYVQLIGFTSWSFIGNFAHVVRTQGVNMLLNVFFGTTLNAAYSVMSQAQGAASQFTSSFELALSPQIYKKYGQGDLPAVQSLVFMGCKLNFILLSVLVGPAIFGMDYLLQVWLGKHINHLALFVNWMLILQLFETVSNPLSIAALATGRIRRYQLVVGGTIMLNLPLTWLAFKLGSSPAAFLYVALAIQLLTVALRVWFMKDMIGLHVPAYLKAVVAPLLLISLLGTLVTGVVISYLGSPTTFLQLLAGCTAICIPTLLISLMIGLSAEERRVLAAKIISKVRSRR